MNNDTSAVPKDGAGRIWCFAQCELDDFRRELRVNGQVRSLETKPMSLLLELLSREGEVATKEELMAAIWPNLNVVEGSLPTAISKLRQVLGDQDRLVIESVHNVGYRIGVPVTQRKGPSPPRFSFALRTRTSVEARLRSRTTWTLLSDRLTSTHKATAWWSRVSLSPLNQVNSSRRVAVDSL